MPIDRKSRIATLVKRLGFERDWALIPLGAAIGAITAIGAVGFAEALHFVEHWVAEARGEWPLWTLPAIPMVGALLTGLLVYFFASEARGHGVPQVKRALIQKAGDIPLRIGIVKVFASIATVGTGGSAGTEGPIVQIGATAGSWISRHLRIEREYRPTLVGCGAAAGIASIFNAPIAGVFFVLEILLKDFSLRTLTPIIIAAVFSAATTQAIQEQLLGGAMLEAIFQVDELEASYIFTARELPSYALLGIVCGLIAVGFNRTLHKGEDLAEKIKLHPIIKPVAGALIVGVLGIGAVLLMAGSGAPADGNTPPFFGNGYATIRSLLSPDAYAEGATGLSTTVWLLGLLVVLKAVATTITLASGGSGGVFAPSLFLGAVGGAAFGVAAQAIGLLPDNSSPAAYALVGMAAVVAGSTHAPLTAILILFELTRDEYVLLPIMLAAIIATVTSRLIDRDSIYDAKLRRDGVITGGSRDITLLRRLDVGMVGPTPLPREAIYASDPVSKLVAMHAYHATPDFPVVDNDGRYIGMVTGADMRTALIDREAIPLLLVAELMRDDIPTVTRTTSLDLVIDLLAEHDVSSVCVVDREGVPLGLITRRSVMKTYQNALERE